MRTLDRSNGINVRKVFAISLVALGVLGLVYVGFSYTQATHKADIGSMHFSLMEKEQVYVPVWAGLAFILVGGLLLTLQKSLESI